MIEGGKKKKINMNLIGEEVDLEIIITEVIDDPTIISTSADKVLNVNIQLTEKFESIECKETIESSTGQSSTIVVIQIELGIETTEEIPGTEETGTIGEITIGGILLRKNIRGGR